MMYVLIANVRMIQDTICCHDKLLVLISIYPETIAGYLDNSRHDAQHYHKAVRARRIRRYCPVPSRVAIHLGGDTRFIPWNLEHKKHRFVNLGFCLVFPSPLYRRQQHRRDTGDTITCSQYFPVVSGGVRD